MPKFKVKHTTILHNKKVYKEGSTIELTEEQAKRLNDFLTLIPESKNQNQNKNKTKTQEADKTAKSSENNGENADLTQGDKNGEQTV